MTNWPLSQSEAAALLLRRRKIRADLTAWCEHALEPAGQKPARHHGLLIGRLEALSRGDIDRLMILLPPGSAKSTYASVLFPPWWFVRHPGSAVIAASHTAELAERFGRRCRNIVTQHSATLGYGVAGDNKAAGRWETTVGGEYFAAGVGGAVTGRRADLILIDDPVKSREHAESEVVREATWDWYKSDLYTRMKPGARIVLVMTRWHGDDLGGRLLDDMAAGGDQWDVLKLPALAVDNDDALGRAFGEPLWPEWESAEALSRKRTAIGERDWSALYQQDPRPSEGALFKVAAIDTIDAVPSGGSVVRAWDLAATAQTGTRDPDYTVGVKLMRTSEGRYVVQDVVRFRGGPDEVETAIVSTARQDGVGVGIGLPQDPGQAGKAQIQYLTRRLAGYRVTSSPETGDKATRAMPVASQCNARNLAVMRAPWNRTFLDELSGFPSATKDDQVDALSRAFGMVTLAPSPAKFTRVNIMGR